MPHLALKSWTAFDRDVGEIQLDALSDGTGVLFFMDLAANHLGRPITAHNSLDIMLGPWHRGSSLPKSYVQEFCISLGRLPVSVSLALTRLYSTPCDADSRLVENFVLESWHHVDALPV